MKKYFLFFLALLAFYNFTLSDIDRTYRELGKGANGFLTTFHAHKDGQYCNIDCTGSGSSQCPSCSLSIIVTGGNNDVALHSYAKNQILLGNLTGNQVSSDGLWKVKWEKKQNQDVSIVAWDLSTTEPALWP